MFFHGYIANRTELRRNSGLPVDAPDPLLVAGAYRRFGESFPRFVYGEYAAAVLDEAEGTLLLTHDALGVVALYYSERPSGLLFGTHIEDLVAATGTGTLDEDYIAQFLAGVEDHGERTPYRHIKRVRQGAGVVAGGGALRRARIYDPSAAAPLRLRHSAEYEHRLRDLCVEAVAAAMPREGKVGCELSGGLDSSTVFSVAAGPLQASIETFSVVFSRSHEADETPWIDAVLEAYPAPSNRLDADLLPPFSTLPDRFHAEPTGGLLIGAFDRARDDMFHDRAVDVVLTGMCGDAVFFGDGPQPYHLADIRNPLLTLAVLRRWQTDSGSGRPLSYWLLRYVVRPRIRRLTRARPSPSPPPPWIRADYRERLLATGRDSRRLDGLSIGREYFWDRVQRGALRVAAGQHGRQTNFQFRNPLLYLPLVEFMAAAPWTETFSPDCDRSLQRRALKGILPERTRLRRGKRGPIQAVLAGFEASDAWPRLLTERPAIVERGYVDRERWREAIVHAQHGHSASTSAFIASCALEAWFASLERAPKPAEPSWTTSWRP